MPSFPSCPLSPIYALWAMEEISGLNVHLCWIVGSHRAKRRDCVLDRSPVIPNESDQNTIEILSLILKTSSVLQHVVNLDALALPLVYALS